MKIDEINSVIIKELLKDGRKSFTKIAEQCKTSKEVIANRYKQMKKQGIIVGSTIQNSCACYDCNLVSFIFVYVEPHKIDQVGKLMSEIPKLMGIFHPSGMSPGIIIAHLIMKNVQELEQSKQSIKRLPFVLDVDPRILIGARNTPENLSLLTGEETAESTVGSSNVEKSEKVLKIDEVDKFIIEKMAADARMPFSNIAKKLKVSTDTVARRYERLKQNGDLKAVIQINPTKIGYRAYAFFNLTFSKGTSNNSIEELSKLPDINFIHKISGKFDCLVSLMIKDIDQFMSVQEQILKMQTLTNMEVSVSKLFTVWPTPREFISTF
jgi:DNA-binding Lrp family transcriptional regulator